MPGCISIRIVAASTFSLRDKPYRSMPAKRCNRASVPSRKASNRSSGRMWSVDGLKGSPLLPSSKAGRWQVQTRRQREFSAIHPKQLHSRNLLLRTGNK